MEVDIINLLQVVGGIILGGGGVAGFRAAKQKGKQEERDSEDKRIGNLLDMEVKLTERMSSLNATIDKHIDRNRELSDRVYESEQEVNRVNNLLTQAQNRIVQLTESLAKETAAKEYYKRWRCERSVCHDPEGRRPPNEKLAVEEYHQPE